MTLARQLWQATSRTTPSCTGRPRPARQLTPSAARAGWMGYFGMRAAPLGPAPAAVVAATFYGFHPAMVARGVPEVWRRTSPGAMLAARLGRWTPRLRRRCSARPLRVARVARAAQACAQAAAGRSMPAGRSGHNALWPSRTRRTWRSGGRRRPCRTRGDGHVAALVHAGSARSSRISPRPAPPPRPPRSTRRTDTSPPTSGPKASMG